MHTKNTGNTEHKYIKPVRVIYRHNRVLEVNTQHSSPSQTIHFKRCANNLVLKVAYLQCQ